MAGASGGRMFWMDLLRGTAVVLVLVFHVGLIFGSPRVVAAFNDAAGGYRLSALFVASGLLLERSLAKGAVRYVDGKMRRIIWPYLIWTAVMAVISGDDRWRDAGWWLFPAGSHTWFLSTLAGLYLLGFATRVVAPGLLAVVLLAANQFVDIDVTPYLHDVTWWGFFFFLGAAASRHLDRILAAPTWVFAAGLVVTAAWSAAKIADHPIAEGKTLLMALMSALGVGTVMWVLARLPELWPLTWVAALGRRSIVTYLLHFPVLILAATHITWPPGGIGFLGITGLTLLVCLVATWGYDRIRWLFELPPGRPRAGSANFPRLRRAVRR